MEPVIVREPLYSEPPTVGMVVGTFAALPYVHLQLEARRRYSPTVPLLVRDDASRRGAELRSLCAQYGADFEANEQRTPPCVGDMMAIAGGLQWAKRKGLGVLLKVSRRWMFRTDWATDLACLAGKSQYATFCSYTTTFDFGFRTECVGLSVAAWTNPTVFEELAAPIRELKTVFVEGFVHNLARSIEATQSEPAERWRAEHPMPHERSGYALWDLMGTDRRARSPNYLWHDCDKPMDYLRAARAWGLKYDLRDFVDPNQGEGWKPKPA